jgi:hypothetical protein
MKVEWTRYKKQLSAKVTFDTTEQYFATIQQWCNEHDCGRRTSYDTFKFKTRADITMFLLRWG